ncbi:MAG: hypothetical protein A4E54_02394 [Pelotomaculum sp. PtaB.Bin117]|nr:MAG: hypothetical protein A4E54_02394 [Pelotomaculum sp. PtaB.Bin117]
MEKVLQRFFHARASFRHFEQDGQGYCFKTVPLQVPDFRQLFIGQNRCFQPDPAAAAGFRLNQVLFAANGGLDGKNNLLANGVNRRVGHLGKQLLKIIVQKLRFIRQYRQRGIMTHRPHRLNPVSGHALQHFRKVLISITKGLLPLEHRLKVRRRHMRSLRQLFKAHQVFVQPLPVRMCSHHACFQLFIADNAAFFRVDKQHAPRAQPFFQDHIFRRDIKHTYFRGQNNEVVFGYVIARGPQAVPVKHGADDRAVRESNGRGAVPRLHQAAVVFIKRFLRVAHAFVVGPRLRNHHHGHVRQGTP